MASKIFPPTRKFLSFSSESLPSQYPTEPLPFLEMNRGDRGAGRGRAASANASSSSRATPSASATTATPARTPGATRASRGASAVTGRFRPKNIRRNEAERDSIAREEEKKASERLAEERRARGRSRFRSTRSRGDAMGRGRGRGGAVAAAAGPFASGFGGLFMAHCGGWAER